MVQENDLPHGEDEPTLPDPGPLPPNNFGLIFEVPSYWLVSHQQHYISASSFELAEAIRDADYTGVSLTHYQGELKVTYMAFDEEDKPFITHMYWNLYKAVTAGPDAIEFFVWAEDEVHALAQLAQVHTAVIEDRHPI